MSLLSEKRDLHICYLLHAGIAVMKLERLEIKIFVIDCEFSSFIQQNKYFFGEIYRPPKTKFVYGADFAINRQSLKSVWEWNS
jgi:hypothetical protein